jgi:hypothetical protein
MLDTTYRPALSPHSYFINSPLTDQRKFNILSLLDCGATGCYLDEGFARAKDLFLEKLPRAIPVYNADGSFNMAGPICYLTSLRIQIDDHAEVITFAVTNLGKSDMILGFDWLRKHNPTVDWHTSCLLFNRCPTTCNMPQPQPHSTPNRPPSEGNQPLHYLEEGDCLWVTKIYEPDHSHINHAIPTPYSHASYVHAVRSGEQQLAQGS